MRRVVLVVESQGSFSQGQSHEVLVAGEEN